MNSIDSECTPLKKQYDDCFNAWFKEYFLSGRRAEVTHEEACGSLFTKYQACLQVFQILILISYIFISFTENITRKKI